MPPSQFCLVKLTDSSSLRSLSPINFPPKMSTATTNMHDLSQVLEEALLVLSEKERTVVTQRFALAGDGRRTLEAIGQKFGITRERVRQIESIALQKLRRTIVSTKLRTVNEIGKKVLSESGGALLEETLIATVLNTIHSVSELDGNIIRLSLAVDETLRKQDRTHQFKPFWHDASLSATTVASIASKAVTILGKQKDIVTTEELVNMLRAQLARHGDMLHPDLVRSALALDHRLKQVGEGWGLMTWRHINPRSIRDKALIIMREHQKPLHFVEIANAISDYGFDKKIVTVQAVHNELIRDENFVLIGRGLYALKEWGYSEGTVSEIIEDLLKKDSPLSKEDIIRGVLRQRQVKKGTISLNLQKCPWFVRVGRAMYELDLNKKTAWQAASAEKRRRGHRKI